MLVARLLVKDLQVIHFVNHVLGKLSGFSDLGLGSIVERELNYQALFEHVQLVESWLELKGLEDLLLGELIASILGKKIEVNQSLLHLVGNESQNVPIEEVLVFS